jgi:hypothetical protein
MRKDYSLTLDDYLFILSKGETNEVALPVNHKNLAWIELGKKYGFDPWTVEQRGNSYYQFTAEEINDKA